MAEKRMFARSLIDSDAFLEMPLSAQALYFHLNMRADDDGFINNPKRITDYVGAAADDLKLLLAKRFIIAFDSGVIVIRHWRMHNTLRSDRYRPTNYQEEFATLCLEGNKAYSELPQTTPAAEPARVEKPAARPAQKVAAAKPPEKKPYGEMQNVLLTDDELAKLQHDYPNDYETYIQRLSLYITSKGARYKSHYAVIRQWLVKDGVKAEGEKRAPVSDKDDLDKVERMLAAMKGGAPSGDHVSP